MTAKDFFDQKFASKLQADAGCLKSSGVTAKSIALDISGSNGGQWTFHFDADGNLKMESGCVSSSATCVISTSDKTFEGMMTGKVNVPMAFVMRKIKVKGDSALAAKMGIALQKVMGG
ncbi:SCP2 sterol-binding domain-containing protein [bacterium]|nr:SCP2 sterol-binding domain-containing protein [bacterium]